MRSQAVAAGWSRRLAGVGLWAVAGVAATPQAPLSVWVTFDAARIGAGVACDGTFSVSEQGRVTVREWLHGQTDTIEGTSYRLSTPHDATSAKAASLPLAHGTSLPVGLRLEIEAQPTAVLDARTKLGDFSVPLDRLDAAAPVLALDGRVSLLRVPAVTPLTGTEAEEECAAITVLPDGRQAVAYVAWDGTSDAVCLRLGDQTRRLTDRPMDCLDPRCAVDGTGRLWVVWTASEGQVWNLWAWRDRADAASPPPAAAPPTAAATPMRLTDGPRNSFWPRLTRDRDGRLWLAWQTVAEDLHYEVMLAPLTDRGLGPAVNASEHPADDWEPAACVTADGRLVVAWDTYRNGSFDIYAREFALPAADTSVQPLAPAWPVVASPKREAHVSVAPDSANRVWLAWDVGTEDWGKHPAKRGALHADRQTEVACYAAGKLWRPRADYMESVPAGWRRFVEYPQLATDAAGRLWLFSRLENQVHPVYVKNEKATPQTYGMWFLFASQYDAERWTAPGLLGCSQGRQDVRVDVALAPQGHLLVAYAADARTRRFPYVPVDYDVFSTSLAGLGVPAREPELVPAPDLGTVAPVRPDPELDPLPRVWRPEGRSYRLLLGDTHRHTDISRCSNGYDGSLQDAYRYALDACGLDWLAISDHDQDILKHRNDRDPRPRQTYDWWRSQKVADLYTIPGRFVALYGYEHGGSYQARGGHKNVIADRRGNPVVEADAPHALFAALADSGALAIPHQLADAGSRTDWDQWNPEFERVGEIFQARGSYEFAGCPRAAKLFTPGNSLWDALAKGIRIGIIASSDHGQTHQARAGVYVVDGPSAAGPVSAAASLTRTAIMEALRARRTFGSTIAVALEVQLGPRVLGEECEVSGPPRIQARIVAPREITSVGVVRNGAFVYTTAPQAREATLDFTDTELEAGRPAYYYVRAQIGENDFAWSSPLWVTRKP